MFKKLFLSVVLTVLFFSAAFAQDDSLYYDLGRVLVKKSATQTVTIKGLDLERYNASNLSDAINVWIYGTYTNNASVVYVIDGNIITDVNAYSIYDIEEVTLVQSAVAQTSGARAGQQMVLIKTRTRREGKKGIVLTGQNSVVNLRNADNTPGASSSNNSYANYYLSGFRNYKKGNIGISAEYQRDVDPSLNGDGLEFLTPANYNRLKFFGYANADLWKGTKMIFGLNFVPQSNKSSYTLASQSGDLTPLNENSFFASHSSQHMLGSNFNIISNITKGLTNRFAVAYNRYNYFETDSLHKFTSANDTVFRVNASQRVHNFLVRDYLSYRGMLDSIQIESTVNFTYRDFDNYQDYEVSNRVQSSGNAANVYPASLRPDSAYKNLMISPSFDIYYKNLINVQGGFVALLNSGKAAVGGLDKANHLSRIYPFFTFTFDPARFLGLTVIKWRVFTSYARQSALLADESARLSGFNLAAQPTAVANGALNPFQQYNSYQAGTAVGIVKNLTVSYSYEFKNNQALNNVTPLVGNLAAFLPFTLYPSKVVTNRFAMSYNYISNSFNWSTSLNGTQTYTQVTNNPALAATYNTAYLGAGHRWSGGFTNRFDCNTLFWGIDLLYQAGQRPFDLVNANPNLATFIAPSNNNSITVQNCYFGTRIKVPHINHLEAYVNSRNLVQNTNSTITDNRRFYGIGTKIGM